MRTVAADDLWLSSSYGAGAVGLHFTWLQEEPEVRSLLDRIEDALLPLGARPHWGKVFNADAGALAERYPRLADFRALRDRLDPDRVFDNGYLGRVLGLGGQGGVPAVAREQLRVGAALDDPAVVEDGDLVGVADGREPVRDGDRGAALRQGVERLPAPRARSRCRARWWPRRAPGSAGRAAGCGRSRSAASRRRRTGGRASRPWCRSRRAARRSGRGSGPRGRRPRSRRRWRRGGRSGGSPARWCAAGRSPG